MIFLLAGNRGGRRQAAESARQNRRHRREPPRLPRGRRRGPGQRRRNAGKCSRQVGIATRTSDSPSVLSLWQATLHIKDEMSVCVPIILWLHEEFWRQSRRSLLGYSVTCPYPLCISSLPSGMDGGGVCRNVEIDRPMFDIICSIIRIFYQLVDNDNIFQGCLTFFHPKIRAEGRGVQRPVRSLWMPCRAGAFAFLRKCFILESKWPRGKYERSVAEQACIRGLS